MTRLPTPGSDDNAWGNILNDFLLTAHNADGTLKNISQNQVNGVAADIAAKYSLPGGGIPEADLASAVQTKLNSTGSGTMTIANAPAGAVFSAYKSGSAWPARPSSRTDITIFWIGVAPAPAIVTSGTGGMLQDVDVWLER
jgi:hypothetical protein